MQSKVCTSKPSEHEYKPPLVCKGTLDETRTDVVRNVDNSWRGVDGVDTHFEDKFRSNFGEANGDPLCPFPERGKGATDETERGNNPCFLNTANFYFCKNNTSFSNPDNHKRPYSVFSAATAISSNAANSSYSCPFMQSSSSGRRISSPAQYTLCPSNVPIPRVAVNHVDNAPLDCKMFQSTDPNRPSCFKPSELNSDNCLASTIFNWRHPPPPPVRRRGRAANRDATWRKNAKRFIMPRLANSTGDSAEQANCPSVPGDARCGEAGAHGSISRLVELVDEHRFQPNQPCDCKTCESRKSLLSVTTASSDDDRTSCPSPSRWDSNVDVIIPQAQLEAGEDHIPPTDSLKKESHSAAYALVNGAAAWQSIPSGFILQGDSIDSKSIQRPPNEPEHPSTNYQGFEENWACLRGPDNFLYPSASPFVQETDYPHNSEGDWSCKNPGNTECEFPKNGISRPAVWEVAANDGVQLASQIEYRYLEPLSQCSTAISTSPGNNKDDSNSCELAHSLPSPNSECYAPLQTDAICNVSSAAWNSSDAWDSNDPRIANNSATEEHSMSQHFCQLASASVAPGRFDQIQLSQVDDSNAHAFARTYLAHPQNHLNDFSGDATGERKCAADYCGLRDSLGIPIGTSDDSPPSFAFKSGHPGVSWNRRMNAWLAFWKDGNSRRSKTFRAKFAGFEGARWEAVNFLRSKQREAAIDVEALSTQPSHLLSEHLLENTEQFSQWSWQQQECSDTGWNPRVLPPADQFASGDWLACAPQAPGLKSELPTRLLTAEGLPLCC